MTTWNDIKEDKLSIPVLDHGFVRLVDVMGDDYAITDAARTSYGSGTRQVSSERNLIRHLMRNKHTSPIEMVELKFHLKMPIFVMRQHVRHRTACLSGDTELDFTGPVSNDNLTPKKHLITVKELYSKWKYGSFGNRNADIDLSGIEDNQYYSANEVGMWFINRKAIANNIIPWCRLKARNNKMVIHYLGSDILLFYKYILDCKKYNHKQQAIRNMSIRSLNEKTFEVYYTHINDIWESGIKELIKITYMKSGKAFSIKASKDHLLFTEKGWNILGNISINDKVWISSSYNGSLNEAFDNVTLDPSFEIWKPCYEWETEYEVSSFGRMRRIKKGRGSNVNRIKAVTISRGRRVVSLSRNGKSSVHHIHRLVANTFLENKENKEFVCHKNGNSLDDRAENLYFGSPQDNSNDTKKHDHTTRLRGCLVDVTLIEHVGSEMTYDIEVTGPYHNFAANGFIVHNSLNEYSGRYSEMSDEFYIPELERFQGQSTSNNQGSAGVPNNLDEGGVAGLKQDMVDTNKFAYAHYKYALHSGLSRELARIQLPVSNYTELYWKIDLKNFFHYVSLRDDKHAQYEIKVFAKAMFDLIQPLFPFACESYNDYWNPSNTHTLSRMESELLRKVIEVESISDLLFEQSGMSKREIEEFKDFLKGV